MDVKRLLELAGMQLCYNSMLFLVPVAKRADALVLTSTTTQSGSNQPSPQTQGGGSSSSQSDADKSDMLKGLAAGFGFFFGLLMLVCVVWCFCCGHVCGSKEQGGGKEKNFRAKVSPSPPRSAETVVRTRPATTSSP